MTPVEGCDRGQAEALGDCDQTGVDATEGLVRVALGQFGAACPVGSGERLRDDLAAGDGAIQRSFCGRSKLAVQQPAGLGEDEFGGEQRAGSVRAIPATGT